MRKYTLDYYDLGEQRITSVFDIIFGNELLKTVHGDTLLVSPWIDNKRTIEFDLHVEFMPRLILHLIPNSKLRVHTSQRLIQKQERWDIQNIIRFPGSRFCDITSTFSIIGGDHLMFTGFVEINVHLFPPLKNIVESFILHQSKKQIELYIKHIKEKFL